MAATVRVSDQVREVLGIRGAGLPANFNPPPQVQCWGCNAHFAPDSVPVLELSAVTVAPNLSITAWSHPGCGTSRLFTAEEFEAVVSRVRPAQGLTFAGRREPKRDEDVPDGTTMLMFDGQPVNDLAVVVEDAERGQVPGRDR